MENLKLKKCNKCGALVMMLKECECGCIACCEEKLADLERDETASKEKHEPMCYKQDNKVFISMDHVQEEDHYIEALIIKTDKETLIHNFTYEEDVEMILGYEPNMKIYALCNKHGLWGINVD